MSRTTVENAAYIMSFGVDHAIGCFVQIWEKRAKGEDPEGDEMEQPQISASEQFGFAINNPKTLERNNKLATEINRYNGNARCLRTEETTIEFGKALGFDVTKEVYTLWD